MPANPPTLNGAPRRPSAAEALTFRPPTIEDELTAAHQLAEELSGPHPLPPSSSPDETADDLPSGSEWPTGESDEDDESGPTSSLSGAERRRASALALKAQTAAARKAVRMAGAMAHQYLAKDDADRAVGLYLVDDDQAAAIADPLARIAARRIPAGSAANNPDVADGIEAMMGLADFVRHSIELQAQASALRVGGYVAAAPDEQLGGAA